MENKVPELLYNCMKAIEESVKILEQGPKLEGLLKHIERVGRISYKSEDKITDTSYEKFVRNLGLNGHWAVFELGTVYLTVPNKDLAVIGALEATKPFTKWTDDGKFHYFTTNYRVISQLDLSDVETYWTEPGPNHFHRVTVDFICSRFTANQIIRHRTLSPIQESQRYVKYDEISYIIPQWACKSNTFPNLSNEDFWNNSTDPRIELIKNSWKQSEETYFKLIEQGVKRESARGVLPLDTKTELCICGYLSDFYLLGVGTEKTGFFNLRTAQNAQEDLRYLAETLIDKFNELGLNTLL